MRGCGVGWGRGQAAWDLHDLQARGKALMASTCGSFGARLGLVRCFHCVPDAPELRPTTSPTCAPRGCCVLQLAFERANSLMNLVAAGGKEGGYDGIRAELAAAYREAGYADVANFIAAS